MVFLKVCVSAETGSVFVFTPGGTDTSLSGPLERER
jgi:hypothetical protein